MQDGRCPILPASPSPPLALMATSAGLSSPKATSRIRLSGSLCSIPDPSHLSEPTVLPPLPHLAQSPHATPLFTLARSPFRLGRYLEPQRPKHKVTHLQAITPIRLAVDHIHQLFIHPLARAVPLCPVVARPAAVFRHEDVFGVVE